MTSNGVDCSVFLAGDSIALQALTVLEDYGTRRLALMLHCKQFSNKCHCIQIL